MLIQRAQLAAKAEDTEGTAVALAAADALMVFDPKFGPNIDTHKRNPVRATLSRMASVSGKRKATLDFGVELKGSGVAGTPPEFGPLLKACGFSETIVASTSVTYLPASESIPSLTLALYEDGVRNMIWGARGNVALDLAAGKPGMLQFSFQGADFSVGDIAMLSGVAYDGTKPPAFLNASFALGGYGALVEKLNIATGNKLTLRPSVNTGSGYLSAAITDREPIGSIDPEMVLVGTHDFYGDWRSGTESAMTATIGATAGNICTVTAPKVRTLNIGQAAREGVRSLGLDFELNLNSGDDELSFAFT